MSTGSFTDAGTWGGRPVVRRLADAAPRCRVVATGTICDTRTARTGALGPAGSFRCELDDGTGHIGLVFLGRPHVPGLTVGVRCTVEGTARSDRGELVLWNPLYRLEPLGDH
ncbi:MAG: DNA-binding protein [Acidimicrobiales bacterium]